MIKGLNIVFWNIRSLLNKIDSVRLEIENIKPDVFNINESWLHEDIGNDFVSIKGYTILRSDRSVRDNGITKRGGGLCTYVRDDITCEEQTDFTMSNGHIELHVIKYNLPYTRDIYIVNVYRPPSGDIDTFITNLSSCIENVLSQRCDVFIGGDFNIDLRRPNSNLSKKLNKFLKLNQLKQLVNEITRPDSKALLDLIITNCDIVSGCGTLDINISDHLPIFIIRKRIKVNRTKISFTGRTYKKLTQENVQILLDRYNWTNFANNDIDTCWNIMFAIFSEILDELCPIKHFKFAKDRPPWLTDDLVNLMKERDRCLKKFRSSKLEIDKIEMRRMRNLVNISVKNARAVFIKDQLEIHKNDPKKFWKELNSLIPNNKSKNNQNFNNIKDDDLTIIPKDQLSNSVNTYFANIGLVLDKKIPPIHASRRVERNYEIEPIERFACINEGDLLLEIKKICIYKSSGLQGISSYFLKICFEKLSQYLLIIMNKSLFMGYFPIKWRRATVVPIPKINIPEEIGDLRPIALTPLPGKILERFVHTQLLAHLNRFNILTEFQNGFRKNHSTIDTIFKYTTDLQLNKNNNQNTISLYVDFKKAFDTVNHKLLITKLKNMKIENFALEWICTYL